MNRDTEKEVWKKKIAEFEASGTTIAEFSRAHGFSPHQYYYWKNKIITKKVTTALPSTSPAPQSQLIKVISEHRPVQRLPDPIWLANFIKALHEAP